MFQAISTPDLALTGSSVAVYARSRSRPGTAMSVTTAEPVFERMSKQGSATHLPSLFTSSRRSIFLPPRRTGSSTTIQSEPVSRENRSSVLRQKRATRILEAQRASVWPHNKKKYAAKTPTRTASPFSFQPPTSDTLQRRFAEAANSASVSRAAMEEMSPNLTPRASHYDHYEGEFFNQQQPNGDRLQHDSSPSLLNSPAPHYDTLIGELKLSLNRLEESVRRAQEHKHDFAQSGAAEAVVKGNEHSQENFEHKHRKSARVISPKQPNTPMNESVKVQVNHENDHQGKHEDRLTRRYAAAVKVQRFYRRYRSRTNFIQRKETVKKDSSAKETIQSTHRHIESKDTIYPKTQSARKPEKTPIDTERTAALLEDFFNQNSRCSPPKEPTEESDRSTASTDRNRTKLPNGRITDKDAFVHYKDNFGVVREKSYDSDEDRSFIESEIRSRVASVKGRIINSAVNQELENDIGRQNGLNDPHSPKVSSTRSTDWKNRRRISTATLILRSSTQPVMLSPSRADQLTSIDLSKSFGEFTHIVNYLEQQMSKDEERRSQISARSIISSKSDLSTVKGSNRSRASSAREVDSIVDEVIREKHVLIELCTNLLQQVHDIGVQMNRYEHKTELRLQKLKSNVRDREAEPLNDQHNEFINERIRELKIIHAAEIDQLKNGHQRTLEAQRLMYENDLAELEKELGEVRERLAEVQESISQMPYSGRQNSTASVYVQTEVLEPEMIDGNEQTIDSNKHSTEVVEEEINWGVLTAEETAILADQYKEIQKEVQSLLSDHDELKTRLLNVVHEKELAEKEIYNKDCEIARLQKQLHQIGEEQSELNTKLSADLTQELDELRLSNADLTDQMSRMQDNYEEQLLADGQKKNSSD